MSAEVIRPEREGTLERLVEGLQLGLLRIVTAPRGLDIEVREAVIHDQAGDVEADANDIVLAVGLDVAGTDAVRLVQRAAAAGAAAVVFRTDAQPPRRIVDAADAAGIAVLATQSEVTWGQLHRLIHTILATGSPRAWDGGERLPTDDLFALANAVAAMVGGPTTIEDRQSNVLAYSSIDEPVDDARRQTILGRRVPASEVQRLESTGVFRELWSTDNVIRIEAPPELHIRPRLAVAVRAGSEILGSIWVAEGSRPLAANAETALREAADIAAFSLIRLRLSDDMDRRRRGEALRAVLDGRAIPGLLPSSAGVEIQPPIVVAAFEIDDVEDAEVALKAQRAVDLVALYAEAFKRSASTVGAGRVIYVLLPHVVPGKNKDRIESWACDVVNRAAESLNISLRCGVGSIVEHVSEIPRARREADQVLRVLRRAHSRQAVGMADELRSQLILVELKDLTAQYPELMRGKVNALVAHDSRKSSDYVATLRAYLDHFGNIPQAARAVHVHENTFRYRLRRLAELSGIDVLDSDERLVVHLQLRLLE